MKLKDIVKNVFVPLVPGIVGKSDYEWSVSTRDKIKSYRNLMGRERITYSKPFIAMEAAFMDLASLYILGSGFNDLTKGEYIRASASVGVSMMLRYFHYHLAKRRTKENKEKIAEIKESNYRFFKSRARFN